MMKKSDIEIGANRKKKKSAGLTIFDALNTPGEEATRVPVAVQPKGFHSNAARWNEVLTPKTFVVKKKRKKKLSIFKKKILLVSVKMEI